MTDKGIRSGKAAILNPAAVPPEGREELDRIRRATERMGQLIDDMLLLSRVTRSKESN